MRSLTGKTALVTGAARGIGRAISLRLASKGMRLALADRDVAGLARTRRLIEHGGGEAIVLPCNLIRQASVDALAAAVLDRWAGVDLLVNNAGVAHHGPTDQMSLDRLDKLIAVNLYAPMRLTRLLLPALLTRPESHVLFVASVLGLTPMPRVSAYCTTKHGLVGYSESLRAEYGRSGLGVTTLCPGFVKTQLIEEAAPDASASKRRDPPGWVCVSTERVARYAVRGIERNRRRVVVDPVGRWVRGAMAVAPGMIDWMNSLGRWKRVATKRQELAQFGGDSDAALRELVKQRMAATHHVERPRLAA